MSYEYEIIHKAVADIMVLKSCSFIEAALEYCEIYDLDPFDFVKKLDKLTIERLKGSAVAENMVRDPFKKQYKSNLDI